MFNNDGDSFAVEELNWAFYYLEIVRDWILRVVFHVEVLHPIVLEVKIDEVALCCLSAESSVVVACLRGLDVDTYYNL